MNIMSKSYTDWFENTSYVERETSLVCFLLFTNVYMNYCIDFLFEAMYKCWCRLCCGFLFQLCRTSNIFNWYNKQQQFFELILLLITFICRSSITNGNNLPRTLQRKSSRFFWEQIDLYLEMGICHSVDYWKFL